MDTKLIWVKILKIIEGKIKPFMFETWFEDADLFVIRDHDAIIKVDHDAVKKQLDENYREIIEEAFNIVTQTNFNIKILTPEDIEKYQSNTVVDVKNEGVPLQSSNDANLNRGYTFENFVVGESNRIAYKCAVAVAENPGTSYNPFFVYGNSGLGKTHLIQAIGNYAISNKRKRVLYVSSQQFKEEFIEALQKDRSSTAIERFKNKYRHVDVLIVDDIQFLSKTEKTQEEFFHTFNVLYDADKQIVISADKSPKELNQLEDRLRTRFSWGIPVNITPPEEDLRIKILKKKIISENVDIFIPDEIIALIAQQFISDVRELEGALRLLLANAAIMGGQKEIDFQFAIHALKTQMTNNKSGVDLVNRIINEVAAYYNITTLDIKGKSRKYSIQLPRQIAMHLSRNITEESFESIGSAFGGRHHSTVMNSCSNIEKLLKNDIALIKTIEDLKLRFK